MSTEALRGATDTDEKLRDEQLKPFNRLPQAESCRLIDFDKAEVRPGFVTGTYILVVSGTKPYMNMEVRLVPRVYVKQPEYWGIEVVGCLPGIWLPAEAPYVEAIPLDGVTGTCGIEVIGATRSEKIDVPPRPGK
jgi:hypothetical protein